MKKEKKREKKRKEKKRKEKKKLEGKPRRKSQNRQEEGKTDAPVQDWKWKTKRKFICFVIRRLVKLQVYHSSRRLGHSKYIYFCHQLTIRSMDKQLKRTFHSLKATSLIPQQCLQRHRDKCKVTKRGKLQAGWRKWRVLVSHSEVGELSLVFACTYGFVHAEIVLESSRVSWCGVAHGRPGGWGSLKLLLAGGHGVEDEASWSRLPCRACHRWGHARS